MADGPGKPPILGEWEKAQQAWDFLRRTTGSGPPLPQQNSSHESPDALVGSNAGTSSGKPAMSDNSRPVDITEKRWAGMSEGERQFFRQNSGWFGGPSGPISSENVTKSGDLPGTKTLDYLGLGLLLATPAVVVEMYLRGTEIDWRKVAVATVVTCSSGGIAVWMSHRWQSWRTSNIRLLPYLAAFEGRFWGRAAIVGAAMGVALALSSVLSSNPTVVSGPPTTFDDIAKCPTQNDFI